MSTPSSNLPITVALISPLPVDIAATPHELADEIVTRLRLQTTQSYSLFSGGSTAPSSNTGPWFKDWTSLRIWSDATGSYVPQVLETDSISDDQLPFAKIKQSTLVGAITRNMLAADAKKDYLAIATMNAVQTITGGGGRAKVVFNNEALDSESIYDSSNYRYIAPLNGWYEVNVNLQIEVDSGSPSNLQMITEIRRDSATNVYERIERETDETGVQTLQFVCPVQLNAGQYVETWFEINDTGAAVYNIGVPNTFFSVRLLHQT